MAIISVFNLTSIVESGETMWLFLSLLERNVMALQNAKLRDIGVAHKLRTTQQKSLTNYVIIMQIEKVEILNYAT